MFNKFNPYPSLPCDQALQSVHVATVVSRSLDRRFGNKRSMCEAEIIEQNSKRQFADLSLSDLFMTVEFGSARSLGIIAVNNSDVIQTDGGVKLLQSFVDACFGGDVIAGNMRVAGIDARGRGDNVAQMIEDFGDLFETRAQRILGSGSVFDEDGEPGLGEVQTLRRGCDSRCGLQESGFAVRAPERAGVKHEIIRTEGHGPFHFPAKSDNGFLKEKRIGAREVDQVIGMNSQRLEVVALAQTQHFVAQGMAKLVRSPLARAGRKYLEGVAAQAVGALCGILRASSRGGMDADAPGSEAGRALRSGTGKNILFPSHGAGHVASIIGPRLATSLASTAKRPSGTAMTGMKSKIAPAIIGSAAALLLLWRLNQPYLWQDEAATGVLAKRMLRSGRPLAYDGVNLITIDHFAAEQADSINQRTRSPQAAVDFYVERGDYKSHTTWKWQPWGQFLVAAFSLKLLGATTLAARLPFAIAGIVTVLMLYRFVLVHFQDWRVATLSSGFLTLDAYWILHCRQCRYYSLSSLFLLLTLSSYASWQWGKEERRWRNAGLFVVAAWCWFQVDFGTFWPVLAILFADAFLAERRAPSRPALVLVVLSAAVAPFAYYYELWGRFSTPAQLFSQRFGLNFLNVNEYVAPGVVVLAAILILILRWQGLPHADRRLIAIAVAIVIALLLWVPATAPAAFLRYVIMAAPVGCLLAAWVFVQLTGPRHRGLLWPAAALFALTPWLSLPFSYPLNGLKATPFKATVFRSSLRVLGRNVFGHPHDPNGPVIEWLKQNTRPDDEILINYEDVPLMFYLPNPIRGGIGSFRVEDDAQKPPDFLVLRRSVGFVYWPAYVREARKYSWQPAGLKTLDIAWGNCPEPLIQEAEINEGGRPIFIARRVNSPETNTH